ncbi:helix-turn-helix domain-containing protein [Bradyrhizobium liaoningense]|uniref:helix-turn-helix domain-containing protein n=1 Tax=Bradyrhizobium liaoningense TaxID=43992 RepID=UPI001BAC6ADF|nr:helix-turn-helix domain-containing protein [Bradyrhizobium liaoningense]MBR0741141.1 helix-turn-helix domain-containing protein [Bradyrhizobium liaoningense]
MPQPLTLEQRRDIATIYARLLLDLFGAMQTAYGRKHLGATPPTFLVGAAIRRNDAEGVRSTVIGIARDLGIPRSSARRLIHELVEYGSIMESPDGGFTANLDFLRKIEPDLSVPRAILAAARRLQDVLDEELWRELLTPTNAQPT